MRQTHSTYAFLTVPWMLWICFFAALLFLPTQLQAQHVEQGKIDLRHIDFSTQSPIALQGNWEFYWNQLLSPADSLPDSRQYRAFTRLWGEDELNSFGYATYSLSIVLPDHTPALSLLVPDFYSSYRLYANGEIVSENGTVAASKEEYTPQWLPLVVPLDTEHSDTLKLLLQVANFDHSKGGAALPIEIGATSLVIKAQNFEYGYAFLLTGALLMGGLFFLGLYSFGRQDKAILYFSLFCIVYSYRIIGFGTYPLHYLLPDLPWILTLKLEYATLFLSGYLFGIYTLSLYPRETSRVMIMILSGISLAFLGASILLPPRIFTYLVAPYFIILIGYITYAFWVYISAAINKRIGARFALASTGMVFFVFIHEIVVYFGYSESSLALNLTGYLGFFFLQSLILSYRFATFLKVAKDRAEESSRAKSQFLSTMSHEIRTPLNAVIGLSGLLSDSNLNPQQKEFSETIKKSGESLLGIINNILDYSKIESGKLELEEVEFNVRELMELVMELTSSVNANEKVELVYYVEDKVPEFIIGDSTRLQQVLLNLVSNALKFTEQGEVYLHVDRTEISGQSVTIRFDIKDTGIGIPDDKMHRLFRSFSQVDASSTRKYGGTGLGLVISKKLIQAMSGFIHVDSKVDEGTTFTFTIRAGRTNRTYDTEESVYLTGKKVFILDDNATNLKILKLQLTKSGIHPTLFQSSGELLNKLPDLGSFDFGILDMQMPDADGVDIAQTIRQRWSEDELPLILLSSIHELDNPNHRKLFSLYLTKPIKQTKLINNLERLYLPEEELDPGKTVEHPQKSLFDAHISVLIAEDNLVNQKVAVQILRRLGIEAQVVSNGKQALNEIRNGSFDIVFMDMEMPVMDGLESTRLIRDYEGVETPENRTLIIAMTANALPGDREKCIQAGMDDFIAKPVTVDSMRRTMKKWFSTF